MKHFYSLILLLLISTVFAQELDNQVKSVLENQTVTEGKHEELFYLENEYGELLPCLKVLDSTIFVKSFGEISNDSIHILIKKVSEGLQNLGKGKPTFKVSLLQNGDYSTITSDSISIILPSKTSKLNPLNKVVIHDIQLKSNNHFFTLEAIYWKVK